MKRRRIWALLLVIVMVCSMLPVAAAAQPYSDVGGHWANTAITTWSDRGVIQGWNGQFNPDHNITRGDMAVIIDKIMGYSAKAENTYTDLPQAYYTDAVLKLAKTGVMQGYGNALRPTDTITREESVVMLARAFGIEANAGATAFADDAKISSWAKGSIAAFASDKYVNGRPGNQFAPQGNITRAETVKVLDNMVSDYITTPGTVTPAGDRIVIVRAEGVCV